MTRSEAEGLLDPFGLKENGVKKAFRKAALYWHPDRGGDAEVFKQMVEARDVLLGKENIWDGFEYMKPRRSFTGPFSDQHFGAPFDHSDFWQDRGEEREQQRKDGEESPRARNTATEEKSAQKMSERYREYLCFYGRKGKFTFTVNGEKFDIFL